MTEDSKTPLTEEQKMRRRVGRVLARAVFSEKFAEANPGADKTAINAAWKETGNDETRQAMRILRRLEKAGYTITPPASDK